jgi:hypothetical protein
MTQASRRRARRLFDCQRVAASPTAAATAAAGRAGMAADNVAAGFGLFDRSDGIEKPPSSAIALISMSSVSIMSASRISILSMAHAAKAWVTG